MEAEVVVVVLVAGTGRGGGEFDDVVDDVF